MRRWGRVLLLALVLTVAGASTTSAASWDGAHYAGERDASTNAVVLAAAEYASAKLAEHGLHECATGDPHRNLLMADDLDGPVSGRSIDCRIWIQTGIVAAANSRGRDPVAGLCRTIAHEEIHTALQASEEREHEIADDLVWAIGCESWAKRVALTARIQRVQRRRHR